MTPYHPKGATALVPPAIVVIDLNPRETDCIACGAPVVQVPGRKCYGLPMREGQFLENDDAGEWGGFDACYSCWAAHDSGGVAGLQQRLADIQADRGL